MVGRPLSHYEPEALAFCAQVKAVYITSGKSVRQCAKEVGITHGTFNRICNGSPPDINGYFKLKRWMAKDGDALSLLKNLVSEAAQQAVMHTDPDDKVSDRFWKQIDVGSPNQCWNWLKPVTTNYPEFRFNGKRQGAHRVALMVTGKYPSKDQHALHSCDNMKCCNPAHLRWGTREENFKDALERNQRFNVSYPPSGTPREGRKLNQDKVDKIKARIAAGDWFKDIAKDMGVSTSTITKIKQGKIWNHE